MSDRLTFRTSLRAALLLGSVVLIAWALFRLAAPGNAPATVSWTVTNTGLPIERADYVAQISESDSGVLVATSAEQAMPLSVPAGVYDVRVIVIGAYPEQVEKRERQNLRAGSNTHYTFDFDYGELDVRTLTPPDDANGEHVIAEVYPAGQHTQRIVSFEIGRYPKLAPGSFDVRVVLNSDSAERHVRWHENVVIEPGRQRVIVNAFDRGFIRVDATDNGESIAPDETEVAVFATGDTLREIVVAGVAGLPLDLASGHYDIEVKHLGAADRMTRMIESVTVRDQETTSVSAAFESASLTVEATAGAAGFDAFAGYFYVFATDDHRSAIAYAPLGRTLRLAPGTYDIRAELLQAPAIAPVWTHAATLQAADVRNLAVGFDSGGLLVHALGATGRELIGRETIVRVYAPGVRARAIARTVAGKSLLLPAGRHHVEVQETYAGATRTVEVDVVTGVVTEAEVVFDDLD